MCAPGRPRPQSGATRVPVAGWREVIRTADVAEGSESGPACACATVRQGTVPTRTDLRGGTVIFAEPTIERSAAQSEQSCGARLVAVDFPKHLFDLMASDVGQCHGWRVLIVNRRSRAAVASSPGR